jgi:hypothetical protein
MSGKPVVASGYVERKTAARDNTPEAAIAKDEVDAVMQSLSHHAL